jgi:NO-binding membrane sensor protein with MHYT domain
MFTVFECVVGQHDVRLVLLAALVWLLGSFTLFLLLERSTDCIEARRQFWLATAAVAAGVGVWATHFIAMLAYDGLLPLRFDPGRTAASAVLAVLFFWAALRVTGREFAIGSSLAAGLLAAAGVIAMHFTGMAAIVAPAVRLYDWSMMAPAIILVSGAFVAAFASFGQLKGRARIAVPASLAMFGVLALHYTAMSATTLIPGPAQSLEAIRNANDWLVPVIVAAALGLIASTLAGAFLDRRHAGRASHHQWRTHCRGQFAAGEAPRTLPG